jgi:imidazolonepropionase-like amidohydrolase
VATIVLRNGTLIDGTGRDALPDAALAIEGGNIRAIGKTADVAVPDGARVYDLDGQAIMPGLTDAHVHFGLVDLSISAAQRESLAVWAMRVRQVIEDTIDMGFTTVRDAGGIDGGFAQAVEMGLFRGPRILPSGSPITQTGGHGDWRQRYQDVALPIIPGLVAMPAICDSPDAVRKAAREQFRAGATQIKVMASGGAMSPVDELETTQLSVEEIAAAVHEANAIGRIVIAHTYSPQSITIAVRAGVKSIEHGNFLDEPSAALMAEKGAYLVPTMVTYDMIDRFGAGYGVPEFNLQKIRRAKEGAVESIKIAQAAGVKIGSGSDLLAQMQPFKVNELSLKAQVMGEMAAIVSSTQTNADLFGLAEKTGTLEPGKWADVIVIDGDPLAGIDCLQQRDNVKLVLKQGTVQKDLLSS